MVRPDAYRANARISRAESRTVGKVPDKCIWVVVVMWTSVDSRRWRPSVTLGSPYVDVSRAGMSEANGTTAFSTVP